MRLVSWWRKYKIRQHTSLDSVVEDTEGNPVTLGEMLVGECEFENKVNGKLEAERIFDRLPGILDSGGHIRLTCHSFVTLLDRVL